MSPTQVSAILMTAISRRQLRHPCGVTDQLRMKTHRHQLRNKPCRFLKQYLQMIPRKVSKVRKVQLWPAARLEDI